MYYFCSSQQSKTRLNLKPQSPNNTLRLNITNFNIPTLQQQYNAYLWLVNVRDLINRFKTDQRVLAIAKSLNSSKSKTQIKGLVGSSDAVIALATYFLQHKPQLFVLPNREEAAYFSSDLESILGKEILLFPSSFRKPFEFTQVDTSNVLARAEVLNELNHQSEYGQIVVTYPKLWPKR